MRFWLFVLLVAISTMTLMGEVITDYDRNMDISHFKTYDWLAHEKFGITRSGLEKVLLDAFRGAFLLDSEKAILVERIETELEEIP